MREARVVAGGTKAGPAAYGTEGRVGSGLDVVRMIVDSSLPIEIRDILLAEGRSEAEIEEVEEALQAEASADEILG